MEVMKQANRLRARGKDVLYLCVGQPSVGAPAPVLQAAREAIATDVLGYTDAMGMMALRERISRYYHERYGVDVPVERIIVTTGSSGAFMLGFMAAFDACARIALAQPNYPPYFTIPSSLDLVPVPVSVDDSSGFQLTGSHIATLAQGENGIAGAVVASPANPTGTMLSLAALGDLVATCERHGVRLISDEIYHGITFGEDAITALELTDHALVINSFSKYFCMTGWRLGWMVLPPDLAERVEILAQHFFISPPTLSQYAAIKAFDCTDELDAIVQGYARNREILLNELPGAGISHFAPADGAFYLYGDVSGLTNDSTAFCKAMLEEAGVAATPGIDFDQANGAAYVRFSFAGEESHMVEAARRIKGWLKSRSG
ncbi:MAG: aminotransferase class I/II-fold pyridoxal phosphate-dependent enzyme [Alphaproteobacteria bacterium]|nr:MAG: aminotransferase class I/II-fold pyridoxal phosphate-dependent enzyme [Alphaproteobacteria bacterium]